MLYYHLSLNGKKERAKIMLESRWKAIDFNSREPRLAQGYENVTSEMLIGLFLEKDEIQIEYFNDNLFSKTGSINKQKSVDKFILIITSNPYIILAF